MLVAQLRGPVIQLALTLAGFHPLTLPDAVIEVLHRQRLQRRRLAVQKRFVKQAQFAGEDIHRPAFGDDVVQGQDEVMFKLRRPDQTGTQQRPGFQIEGLMRLAVGQRLNALLTNLGRQRIVVLPLHAQAGLPGNFLAGHAVDAREGSTQGFVAQDQGLQRGLETLDIEHTVQARHAADVVRRAVRFHLPEEPHALLRIGQRHRLAAIDAGNRLQAVACARLLKGLNLFSECAQLAGLEQRPQRQVDVASLTHTGNDLRGQQRVPAQLEKVIAQADTRHAQHLSPDSGDLLLQVGVRLDMFAGLPLRLGQGAAIQLAARAQRHAVEAHQLRRDHVVRQFQRQGRFDVLGLNFLPGFGGVITDQLRASGGFAHQHGGVTNARLSQQAGFDFLRFDAETAQFDLLIETPQIFQRAISRPAHKVTRAVQAFARLAQRIGDKAFGSQARTVQITTRQADATDAQLTGHPAWQRVQLAVQHPAQHVTQRTTDGRTQAIGTQALPMSDVDRGFGRAITVVQLHVRQLLQHPVAQFTRQRFAAGEQATQATALLRQRFVDEQLQQRRHEMQRGHAIFVDQLRDSVRVAVFAGACQQQAAAGDQRPETFPHRHVEADRCLLHQHVGFVQRVRGLHPLQALGQGRVGVADAFGLTGGTRGVNHVGQIVAVQVQARRADRPVVQVQHVHRQRANALGTRQVAEQMALGQQQFDAAVLQHVGQSIRRVIRVQRHVSATGLEDRQQTDQQLWRTLGGNRHLDVRADAFVTQVMRQTIGLGMQAGEIEAAALPHQRNTLRGLQRLTLQQFRQPVLRRRAGRGAPLRLFGQLVSVE
ncbi:putative non-ribosomal peptide synthetase [Pseudomonas syringae pv. maculicola]|nr:putative non-ribosomal peptide synthetase [Pseudomonas syringae pv. maculicola]